MNQPSSEYSFSRHTIFNEMLNTLRAQPADVKVTAERFSLVRPSQRGVSCDILLRNFRGLIARHIQIPEQHRRLLVIETSPVDLEVHGQLAKAHIPHAELVGSSERLLFFNVAQGSKLLSREPLRERQSSPTYISDAEIFNNVGRLYGAAWRATGRLLVSDVSGDQDRISDRVAIVNFSEAETSNIYLCPPYANSQQIPDVHTARQTFIEALQTEQLDRGGVLATAALEGFDDIMQNGWR